MVSNSCPTDFFFADPGTPRRGAGGHVIAKALKQTTTKIQIYWRHQNPELQQAPKSRVTTSPKKCRVTASPKIQSYRRPPNPELQQGQHQILTRKPPVIVAVVVAPPMDHASGDKVSGHGSLRKANRSEYTFCQQKRKTVKPK